MSVISFANKKGGAGKSTAALIFATELAADGATVTVIDADPTHVVYEDWAGGSETGPFKSLTHEKVEVVRFDPMIGKESKIRDVIADASRRSAFVVVDLEGTGNPESGHAVALSDLVVVPIQMSSLDINRGSKTLKLIAAQSKVAKRQIPFRFLVTRFNPAIMSDSDKSIERRLRESNVPMLRTRLVERSSYRDMFLRCKSLRSMDGSLVKVAKARVNALEYRNELVDLLAALRAERKGSEKAKAREMA